MAGIVASFHALPGVSVTLVAGTVALAALLVYAVGRLSELWSVERPLPGFPVASIDGLSPKDSWAKRGADVLQQYAKQDGTGEPFQVITGTGPKIALPARYADEIQAHEARGALSLPESFRIDFFEHYPGFEGIRAHHANEGLIADVVRSKLTRNLGRVTEDLIDEARNVVSDVFGEVEPDKQTAVGEWQTGSLKPAVLEVVGRLSSRVFLGPKLGRDRRWLDISQHYTVSLFSACRALRRLPAIARPFMHWFLEPCIDTRRQIRAGRELMSDEVARRKMAAELAIEESGGRKAGAKVTGDAIAWMVEITKERSVDLVGLQLALSMAAIHTATEALSQAMLDLCQHQEVVPMLREEIVRVVGEYGWGRTALHQLHMMDSFLKESQRMHGKLSSMHRRAMKECVLSDGTVIPRGARIFVISGSYNPAVYEEPFTFDAARFLRNRREQPKDVTSWCYVTPSPAHLGFGYGPHACPGRFFAAKELKVALCHLLLKYDFALEEGVTKTKKLEIESLTLTDSRTKLRWRMRTPEISL